MAERAARPLLWLYSLLLLCGDVELNPGPPPSSSPGRSLPTSRSKLSMASIRSVIEKRRKSLYIEPTPLWGSCRLVLALMGFWGFLNVYAMRVNLSVAMVCMINHTAVHLAAQHHAAAADVTAVTAVTADVTAVTGPSTTSAAAAAFNASFSPGSAANMTSPAAGGQGGSEVKGEEEEEEGGRCGTQSGNSSLSSNEDGEFTWSKETQGLILGSFFWGYMTTQIPGGWLGARFGGKRVYGFFMLGCAFCTLLMPVAARTDFRFLLALRFLAGVGQGVTFPAMNVLWASWAPPLESSQLGSIGYSGSQVGNVLTFPIAGLLCEHGLDGGWPSIFYLLGVVGVVWFVVWSFLVFDSPAEHPRISPEEKTYITTSLRGKMAATREGSGHVPWRALLTSRAVWGIILTHTCSNFGTYTFLTNIPTYLKEVLHFDIKQNGLLSALPYVGFWLAIVLSGQMADFARCRGYLTTTQARKVGNSLGMLLPGVLVAAVGYMSCEQSTSAVVLLTIGVACSGFQYGSGWMVNPVDIAPRYAGLIFGLSNTMATIPGFLAPMAIGHITAHQTQAEWQTVFFIATAIYTVGALAYIILGSGEIQPWAKQDPASPQDPAGDPTGGGEEGTVEEPLLTDKGAPAGGQNPKQTSRVAFKEQPEEGEEGEEGRRSSSAHPAGEVKFY